MLARDVRDLGLVDMDGDGKKEILATMASPTSTQPNHRLAHAFGDDTL